MLDLTSLLVLAQKMRFFAISTIATSFIPRKIPLIILAIETLNSPEIRAIKKKEHFLKIFFMTTLFGIINLFFFNKHHNIKAIPPENTIRELVIKGYTNNHLLTLLQEIFLQHKQELKKNELTQYISFSLFLGKTIQEKNFRETHQKRKYKQNRICLHKRNRNNQQDKYDHRYQSQDTTN